MSLTYNITKYSDAFLRILTLGHHPAYHVTVVHLLPVPLGHHLRRDLEEQLPRTLKTHIRSTNFNL